MQDNQYMTYVKVSFEHQRGHDPQVENTGKREDHELWTKEEKKSVPQRWSSVEERTKADVFQVGKSMGYAETKDNWRKGVEGIHRWGQLS